MFSLSIFFFLYGSFSFCNFNFNPNLIFFNISILKYDRKERKPLENDE
jgi:hypothetical protein